jgi:hypothetical protein
LATAALVEGVDLDEDRSPGWTPPRANLGAAILLSAVEDYRDGNLQNHNSAKLFLYPQHERYENHLAWAAGYTEWTMVHLRATLDRERPQWDAARKGRK